MPVTIYQYTQCFIPQDTNTQQHRSKGPYLLHLNAVVAVNLLIIYPKRK